MPEGNLIAIGLIFIIIALLIYSVMPSKRKSILQLPAGITIVDGIQGSGKTGLIMTYMLKRLREGRKVYTNVRVSMPNLEEVLGDKVNNLILFADPLPNNKGEPWDKGYPGDGCMLWTGEKQLFDTDIIIDEAHRYFSFPGAFNKMPPDLADLIKTNRHRGNKIMCMTTDLNVLAKGFRADRSAHVRCADLRRAQQKLWGVFRVSFGGFAYTMSCQPKGGYGDPVFYMTDKDAKRCYDTTGGTVGYEPERESHSEVIESGRERLKATSGFVATLLIFGTVIGYGVHVVRNWGDVTRRRVPVVEARASASSRWDPSMLGKSVKLWQPTVLADSDTSPTVIYKPLEKAKAEPVGVVLNSYRPIGRIGGGLRVVEAGNRYYVEAGTGLDRYLEVSWDQLASLVYE